MTAPHRDPASPGAALCLGLLLALGVGTALGARFAAGPDGDRSEITSALHGDGALSVAQPIAKGKPLTRLDGRLLHFDGPVPAGEAALPLRLLGHDDTMQFLLYVRADGMLDGDGGTVYRVRTSAGEWVRLVGGDTQE